ncbi:MAG: DUF1778 domain-containing protein [Azospirillaceae bacterium]|nr:DUF1778 domain-containing protein [Azospirillaceae bacterium]
MEQRTLPEIKSLIEDAAAQLGISPSEFVVSSAAWAARETLSKVESTRLLTPEDCAAFVRALENTEPSQALRDLMALDEETAVAGS